MPLVDEDVQRPEALKMWSPEQPVYPMPNFYFWICYSYAYRLRVVHSYGGCISSEWRDIKRNSIFFVFFELCMGDTISIHLSPIIHYCTIVYVSICTHRIHTYTVYMRELAKIPYFLKITMYELICIALSMCAYCWYSP